MGLNSKSDKSFLLSYRVKRNISCINNELLKEIFHFVQNDRTDLLDMPCEGKDYFSFRKSLTNNEIFEKKKNT